MAGSPVGRQTRVGAWTLLAALAATTSCGDEDPATRETSRSGSESASTEPLADDAAVCRAAQARAARRMDVGNAFDEVVAAQVGGSPQGARWVRSEVRRVARRVTEKCGDVVPAELDRFVTTVTAAVEEPEFDAAQVTRVRRAWAAWADSVGVASDEIGQFQREAACQEIVDGVDASYRVGWRWEGAEKVWSIELTWENRLGGPVFVQFGGSALVTGYARRAEPWERVRGGVQAVWGGGSAELGNRPAGRSTEPVFALPEPRTTADGTVEISSFYADVSHGQVEGCAVEVTPGR